MESMALFTVLLPYLEVFLMKAQGMALPGLQSLDYRMELQMALRLIMEGL